MIYLRLFFEFFKTGLFSVGGGLATLPFLYNMADSTGWFSREMVVDMLAVSESTPGPIGVNMATYVGFEVGGVFGAVVATIGIVSPSVIVILIIASFMQRFRDSFFVSSALYGLRPASVGLIAAAGASVCVMTLLNTPLFAETGLFADLINWRSLLLACVIWVMTNLIGPTKKLHPFFFVAVSAAVGVVFSFAGA